MTVVNDTHEWIDATYSAEDNKLRLYCAYRLDDDLYQRVKAAGFKWAPKQELFVAPRWTPTREDLCLELAGDIEPEGTTLAERAEMKADRLAGYAEKRSHDANAFSRAAHQIGERFAGGQPILVGHHSERKARKDQQRMHNAMDAANKASKLADYWQYRTASTLHHANYKNKPAVRARRIKTLLAELRDFQRTLNHNHKAVNLWLKIQAEQDPEKRSKKTEAFCGAFTNEGSYSYESAWDDFSQDRKSVDEIIEKSLEVRRKVLASAYYPRWIEHTLNRLAYETALLGEIPRFDGELTASILQRFCRTHGADKPKATQTDSGWQVASPVPFPVHLGDGKVLEHPEDGWRELMQSCGYDVVANQPRPRRSTTVPLLNIDAETLATRHYRFNNGVDQLKVLRMTKGEYAKIRKESKETRLSLCGQFRFRSVFTRDPGHTEYTFSGSWKAVFLTDSKAHPLPETPKEQEAA